MATGLVHVFIAYSRKDGDYLDRLRTYLKPLDRDPTISIWYDGEIVPGTIWEKEIKENLHQADIILLLVSANSLASDYFYDREMTDALQRHRRGKTSVVPIILSDCNWELTELKDLQALPEDGQAISSWEDEAAAYANIVRHLHRSVETVKQQKAAPTAKRNGEKVLAGSAHDRPKVAQSSHFLRKYGLWILGVFLAMLVVYQLLPESVADGATAAVRTPVSAILLDMEKNMVDIPAGTFTMGCTNEQLDTCYKPQEMPPHDVSVARFRINRYEVTEAEWREVMGNDNARLSGCDDCAVGNVSWNEAQEFLSTLNSLTGKNYRLPSEAEWEYAARAGTNTQYAGTQNELEQFAWYGKGMDCSPHPVGQKKPNRFQLYDLSGNVFEWCQDTWYDYQAAPRDGSPVEVAQQPKRITRGGSCKSNSMWCRVSLRHLGMPDEQASDFGLRLASTPS